MPIQVEQPVRMMTADLDPVRFVGGAIPSGATTKLADGPLYLTDAFVAGTTNLFVAAAGDCASQPQATIFAGNYLNGARWFIPAGSALCAATSGNGGGSFAGFRPY